MKRINIHPSAIMTVFQMVHIIRHHCHRSSLGLFVSSFSLHQPLPITNYFHNHHHRHRCRSDQSIQTTNTHSENGLLLSTTSGTSLGTRLYSSSSSSKKQTPTATTTTTYIEPSLSGYKPPSVNWYPGHIAKAERSLSETLTSADVLLEIRDARIPKSTSHPRVREWTVGKPRIVVFTRVDTVPKSSVRSWSDALNLFGAGNWDAFIQDGNVRHQARQNRMTRGVDVDSSNSSSNKNVGDDDGLVEDVIYVDAKRGAGMPSLLRAIGRAGAYVNEKRLKRGLRERPLRLAVLGYPNVG